MNHRRWLVASLLVASILVVWLFARSADPAEMESNSAPSRLLPAASPQGNELQSTPTSAQRGEPDDGKPASLTVLVKDSAGAPIPDARVCPVTRYARSIPVQLDLQAVRTDHLGVARIAFEPTEDTVLGVRALGYRSRTAEWPSDGQAEVVVQLEPEERLEISVRDPLGTPIPDVTVMLARQEITRDAITAGHDDQLLDGLDSECSQHSVLTNGSGEALARGLSRGKYLIGVRSEYYEVLDRQLLTVDVPGPKLEVVMVPLTAAVLQIKGDQIFNYNWEGNAGLVVPTPHSYSMDSARQRLQERFPDGKVFVGAVRSVSETPQVIPLKVLLVEHGRREIDVPMQLLTEDIQPMVVDFTHDFGPRTEGSLVTFRFRNPSGTLIACEGFHLVPASLGFSFSKAIDSKQVMRVPYGTYRLKVLRDPLKQKFKNQEIVIDQPEQVVEVELLHEFVPVQLLVKAPPGILTGTVGVQWICDPDHKARVQTGGMVISSPWTRFEMPAGPATLQVNAYQCEPWEERLELLALPQGETRIIEVALKRSL
jgi:hypothetical protein